MLRAILLIILCSATGLSSSAAQTSNLTLGLDIRLTHSFDLRLPDLGATAPFDQGNGGKLTTGAGIFHAGIVYHLPSHAKPAP